MSKKFHWSKIILSLDELQLTSKRIQQWLCNLYPSHITNKLNYSKKRKYHIRAMFAERICRTICYMRIWKRSMSTDTLSKFVFVVRDKILSTEESGSKISKYGQISNLDLKFELVQILLTRRWFIKYLFEYQMVAIWIPEYMLMENWPMHI